MKKAGCFLSKLFEYIVIVPVLLISGYLFIESLFVRADLVINMESEKTYFVKNNILISFIFITAILFISFLITKKLANVKEKTLLTVLVAYTFVVEIIIAIVLNTVPGADQSSVLYAAGSFASGDYRMLQYNWYLGFYPFQLPLVMLDEMLYHIFGGSTFIFWNFLNAILISLIQYLIFKIISVTVRDETEKRWVYLFLYYDFPILLYVSFVYGTIISLALCLWAILILINPVNEKWTKIIGASLLMAVACLLRNNSLVIFIAISIYCVWELIKKNKKLILFIPATLIIFFAAKQGINAWYEFRSGIQISDGVPVQLHIATGLSENDVMANGWYNKFTYDKYIELDFDNELAKQFGEEEIKKSLAKFGESPEYAYHFFKEKICSTWTNSDFQGLWNNEHHGQYKVLLHIVDNLYHGNLHVLAETILNWFVVLTYGGLFLYSFNRLLTINKKDGNSENIFLIIFLGGFFFHLMWETKAQYVIVYYALLLPYAGIGWKKAVNEIQNYALRFHKK